MSLRPTSLALASFVLVLGLAISARADFTYVRSIPAPDIPGYPDCVTGLDHTQTSLMVVTSYLLVNGSSFVFLVNPATGAVERRQEFPGAPTCCESNFYQLAACTYQSLGGGEVDYYWTADECGEIEGFEWPDSIYVAEQLTVPGVTAPISLASAGDSLLVLDRDNGWVILRHDCGEVVCRDTISLADGPSYPAAMTVWRNHILVSSYPDVVNLSTVTSEFGLWEYTMDGGLVTTHIVQSAGNIWPSNMTFFDGLLYVAGDCEDNIQVFEPAIFNPEVPAGDSVVVEVIPERVEVTFDSVSTAGSFLAETVGSDPCPPPDGVEIFEGYHHLVTDARFDYAAQVVVSTTEPLPPYVDPALVRVLVRPSGDCLPYRDITVAPTELPTALSATTRTKSEDDEFSVFALGQDHRPPRAVIELKHGILEGTIDGGQDSIPPDPELRMRNLLGASHDAYYRGLSLLAADYVDSIALTARPVPAIPHVYDPDVPGRNLAGRLISDAHTLAFSLRFSESQSMATEALVVPPYLDESPDGFIRTFQDVPAGLEVADVDPEHIFIQHQVRAIPESTSVAWYPTGKMTDIRRVRAVFHADEVAGVLPPGGVTTVRLTSLISGYEVFSDPLIYGPGAGRPAEVPAAQPRLLVKSNPPGSSFVFEVSSLRNAAVEIGIYSVRGELVKTLVAGPPPAGVSFLTWHGDNYGGSRVSPGAYFVVVRLAGETLTTKVVLRR